ncbi:HAD family phosphatase [bacterium]|nr:HAD family phosphatase [bacterium]
MQSKYKFSAILFDLGNVFIQVNPVHSIQKLEESSSLTYMQIQNYFTDSEIMRLYEKGLLTNRQFYQQAVRDLDLTISMEHFKTLWQSIFSLIEPMIRFLDEIRHRYPCYILSNTNAWHSEHCESCYPFMQWFKKRFYSHELGEVKPNPEIFHKALAVIGLPPKNILFVDDRKENVRTAKQLGIQIIHFTDDVQFVELWKGLQNDFNLNPR